VGQCVNSSGSCLPIVPGVLITWYGFTDIGVSKPVSVLLSLSDSAVKQILLTLDERPGQSFIIEDLDEFHVLIRADEEQRVRRELEAEVRPHPDVVSFLLSERRTVGEEYI
jgi:TFIIH basal transcription factor complex TTD-A subunit